MFVCPGHSRSEWSIAPWWFGSELSSAALVLAVNLSYQTPDLLCVLSPQLSDFSSVLNYISV